MLTEEQKTSLEWLNRLCEPSMYRDRLGPIRDYIMAQIAASATTPSAPVQDNERLDPETGLD